MENFRVFVNFGVNLRFFHSQHCNYLLIKVYWTTSFHLLTLYNIPIHEDCQNFTKKIIETLKKGKSFFVIFGVTLRKFHLENCNKLFGKAYWTTHLLLVDPFQRSNPQSPSEIWKKVPKTRKVRNFCHSRC